MSADEFEVAVPVTESREAKRLFNAWLEERGLTAQDIGFDNVQVDLVCARDGVSRSRFNVRKRALEAALAARRARQG